MIQIRRKHRDRVLSIPLTLKFAEVARKKCPKAVTRGYPKIKSKKTIYEESEKKHTFASIFRFCSAETEHSQSPDAFFLGAKYTLNAFATGALPRNRLGDLYALPCVAPRWI